MRCKSVIVDSNPSPRRRGENSRIEPMNLDSVLPLPSDVVRGFMGSLVSRRACIGTTNPFLRKSGIGLPHSKTSRSQGGAIRRDSVLECGSPMPLSRVDYGIRKPDARQHRYKDSCGDCSYLMNCSGVICSAEVTFRPGTFARLALSCSG
jgi:hypothetical protein